MTTAQTPDIEALLAEHEYMLQNSRGSICRCGFVPTVDADSLKTQQDYHRAHVADRLAAAVREARAAELREATRAWQTGEWTVLTPPIKAETQPQRIIGAAQAVTEWLRDRADRITEPVSHNGGSER